MTTRGERTRERLLDAAELLYGDRGVEAVSFREIRLAAGQRNSSALQFHFGDRDGLLLALTQRHVPRIGAIQQDLYDRAEADGRLEDPAAIVEVLMRPAAEYIRRGPGERAWIKLSATQIARPETALSSVADHVPPATLVAGAKLHQLLSEKMPVELASDRLLSVSVACLHLCADRARFEDARTKDRKREELPIDQWIANLVDMAIGALFAPARTSAPIAG